MARPNCTICAKSFYAKPSHLAKGWGKYCSKACQFKGMKTGKSFPCYICGKETYRTSKDQINSESGRFFCNKSCQAVWRNSVLHIGENHSNWRGGTASYRSILLKSGVPQICMRCQLVDKRVLAVHHKDKDRSNNALSNLIWLCHNCHFLVHHNREESIGFVVPVA